MRFLVDQNLSRKVAAELRAAGHDVAHTSEVGLSTASDHAIAELAVAEARVVRGCSVAGLVRLVGGC
jgi:predicted nuclease of predicted toxin-antitoxin system